MRRGQGDALLGNSGRATLGQAFLTEYTVALDQLEKGDAQMSDPTGQFRSLVLKSLYSKYFVPVCLVSALIVRVCWISLMDPEPVSDFGVFYNSAVALSEGRGYSSVLGAPSAVWPVGYPGFLSLLFAVFGPSVFVGKMANVILYMGILLLSYYLARNLFNSELTGRVTLAILSFYPNHIAYCSLLASEIPSTFLLLLGISLLILAERKLFMGPLSGSVFGLGCLVRPQILLVPALFFAEALSRKIKERTFRRHLVLFLVTFTSLALTILPWEIRNYHRFGAFVFVSATGGTNLLSGNNPHATGRVFWSTELERMLEGTKNDAERDSKARTLALHYMRQNPLKIIRLLPSKFYYLYSRDTDGAGWNEEGMRLKHGSDRVFFRGFKIFSQGYYMSFMIAFFFALLFLFGSKRYRTRFPQSSIVGLWIIAYYTGLALVYYGSERHHFQIMPWIVMYVGALAALLVAPRGEGGPEPHQVRKPGFGTSHMA
jgi:4-amino-4-deoxy-L-arabinose transferase-like glycosyltransferase